MRAFADDYRLAQVTRVLLIPILAACTSTPEPEMPEMAAFGGNYSGTTTLRVPGARDSLDRCNANASDGEHSGLTHSLLVESTGELTVLGPVTMVGSGCTDPEGSRFAQGEMSVRTARGDALMTEFHGRARLTVFPFGVGRLKHQIVGGTGRFAQAEGTFVCEFRFRRTVSGRADAEGPCHGDISL